MTWFSLSYIYTDTETQRHIGTLEQMGKEMNFNGYN